MTTTASDSDDYARVDALADVDGEADPEPWLGMLRNMSRLGREKVDRYRGLFAKLALGSGSRVLEVGCGAGGLIALLAGTTPRLGLAVGIDPSRLAVDEACSLDRAEGRSHPAFLAADGRALPFADAGFDAAFCSRVLVHAPEPPRILDEMVRVVRPGGRLLFVEPDRQAMLSSTEADDVLRAFWSDRRSLNPRIGTRLYPLLVEHGLRVEHVDARFNVSRQPPSERDVQALEEELVEGSGEHWDLIHAGRVTADQFSAYVHALRRARQIGAYLRTDVEFVYVARKR
jgi:ubiquinone/menaquinone biosynthesis C-methylase UbiE